MKAVVVKGCRRGSLRLHILPIMVWVAAVVGVFVLFRHRSQRFEVLGLAQRQVRQIAATCRGRLKSVPVQLFEKVSQGDTIAVLDTVLDDEHLGAELATISAEIQHLVAESNAIRSAYVAEVDNRRSEWVAEQRAFTSDVVAANLRVLELMAVLENDRMALEALELNIKSFIAQHYSEADDAELYELQKLKAGRNTLPKKIEENERLLEKFRQQLKEATDRRDEFVKSHRPQVGTPDEAAQDLILKAVKVLERQMNELNVRHEELVLKSPVDGVVNQIQGRVGEAVLPGAAIVTIVEDKPRLIITYAREDQVNLIRKGTGVKLIKESEPAQIALSKVSYIGPIVEQMPVRLWQNPNIPQWGRPILIEIPPGLKLVPGEVVGIRGL